MVVRDPARHEAGALRAELDRRRARAAGLLPRAPRAAHAAPADGRAHRERARGRRRGWTASTASTTSAGPASRGWSRSGTRTRRRIVSATRIFSLAESLGGVESLIEVPQAMTHQSVEGSGAAVPADLVRLSCGIEARRGPRRGPRAGDRRGVTKAARVRAPMGWSVGFFTSKRRGRRHPRLDAPDRPDRPRRPDSPRSAAAISRSARPARTGRTRPAAALRSCRRRPRTRSSLPPLPEGSRAKAVEPVAGAASCR